MSFASFPIFYSYINLYQWLIINLKHIALQRAYGLVNKNKIAEDLLSWYDINAREIAMAHSAFREQSWCTP
jgi:hypothetical protein